MTNETFEALVKEIREKSLGTLLKKNANYADEDRLHNFKVGAAITGGTPAQAALGYMAKHLASLQDKVRRNDFHDREDLLEKCQDIINYVVFIWCCGNEEREKYNGYYFLNGGEYLSAARAIGHDIGRNATKTEAPV